MDVLSGLPRFAGNDYVFAGRGANPFDGGNFKAQFDAKCGVTGCTLHDLRRTARSLMSRAGVAREIAERILGHSIGSTVEAIYDRHRYDIEKANALRALADLIARIVDAPSGNVVELRRSDQVRHHAGEGRSARLRPQPFRLFPLQQQPQRHSHRQSSGCSEYRDRERDHRRQETGGRTAPHVAHSQDRLCDIPVAGVRAIRSGIAAAA
jgi:hypothetical protein